MRESIQIRDTGTETVKGHACCELVESILQNLDVRHEDVTDHLAFTFTAAAVEAKDD